MESTNKGFKMAFMMKKLAMIKSCEIILEIFFAKNHCEIQVRTILVCTLYSINTVVYKKCFIRQTPCLKRKKLCIYMERANFDET